MNVFRLRVAIGVLAIMFAVGHAWLGGVSTVLEAAAPTGCPAAGPVVMQWGPGSASRSDLSEVVTGWYEYTQQANGTQSLTHATVCSPGTPGPTPSAASTTPAPDTAPALTAHPTRDGRAIAETWITVDMALFTPIYGLLIIGLLWYAAVNPSYSSRTDNALLWAMQRIARWLPGRPASTARPPWILAGLVVLGCLMDELENAQMLAKLDTWWQRLESSGPPLVITTSELGAIHRFGVLKWALLIVPAVLAVLIAGHIVLTLVRLLWSSLRRLWVQLAAALVFVALCRIGQGADAIRRLSPGQWAATVGVLLVFGLVLSSTAAGLLKPRRAQTTTTSGTWRATLAPGAVWIGLGLVAFVVGWLTDRGGAEVFGYLLGGIGLLSLLLDVRTKLSQPPDGTSDRQPGVQVTLPIPTADHRAAYVIAPGLVGVILAGFGWATVAATAGDAALLNTSTGGLAGRMAVAIGLAVVAVPATVGMHWLLRWLYDRTTDAASAAQLDQRRFVILASLATLLVVVGFLLHDSGWVIGHGPALGALNIVAVFLASFCLIGSLAEHLSFAVATWLPNGDRIAVPTFLRTLGFKEQHSPVIGLLIAWALLATTVSYGHRYDMRQIVTVEPRPAQLTVGRAVKLFQQHQPPDRAPAMLMVAASGGGVRAEFWTALVLTCIIETNATDRDVCGQPLDPTTDHETLVARRRALFALSGASGGSVGLVDYVAQVGDQWSNGNAAMTPVRLDSVGAYAGADFLSAPIAAYLFDDLFDSFLRPQHGVDRAEVLERAWERAWPSGSMMTKGFYTHQATGDQPFLLLNGTNVENACRVLVSPIKTQVEADARFCSRDGELPAPPGAQPPHDEAGSTIDLANQLCASCDIRFSTAALASARFPFVSPAGRVDDADGGTTIDVVDGGYRDNSGASTLVDLWPSVAAAATETFGSAGECVRPIFLQIDNGYAATATATSAPIDINQVLVPLQTERNIAGAVENAARQQSQHLELADGRVADWFQITTVAAPGTSAPLGWVLSIEAQQQLHRQLQLNAGTIAEIRELLDSDRPPCTPT